MPACGATRRGPVAIKSLREPSLLNGKAVHAESLVATGRKSNHTDLGRIDVPFLGSLAHDCDRWAPVVGGPSGQRRMMSPGSDVADFDSIWKFLSPPCSQDALDSFNDMRGDDKQVPETQRAMLRTTHRTRRDKDQLTQPGTFNRVTIGLIAINKSLFVDFRLTLRVRIAKPTSRSN